MRRDVVVVVRTTGAENAIQTQLNEKKNFPPGAAKAEPDTGRETIRTEYRCCLTFWN
jgi:hypothetical protein